MNTCTYCGKPVPKSRHDWYCSSDCHRAVRMLFRSVRGARPVDCKRCGGPIASGFMSFCSTACLLAGKPEKSDSNTGSEHVFATSVGVENEAAPAGVASSQPAPEAHHRSTGGKP